MIKYTFSLSPFPVWTSPSKSQGKKSTFSLYVSKSHRWHPFTGVSIGVIHPWDQGQLFLSSCSLGWHAGMELGMSEPPAKDVAQWLTSYFAWMAKIPRKVLSWNNSPATEEGLTHDSLKNETRNNSNYSGVVILSAVRAINGFKTTAVLYICIVA